MLVPPLEGPDAGLKDLTIVRRSGEASGGVARRTLSATAVYEAQLRFQILLIA